MIRAKINSYVELNLPFCELIRIIALARIGICIRVTQPVSRPTIIRKPPSKCNQVIKRGSQSTVRETMLSWTSTVGSDSLFRKEMPLIKSHGNVINKGSH